MQIDKNFTDASAATVTGLHVDFDRTVPGSGTANFTDIGIDLDCNSAGLGTTTQIGLDVDVVGAVFVQKLMDFLCTWSKNSIFLYNINMLPHERLLSFTNLLFGKR